MKRLMVTAFILGMANLLLAQANDSDFRMIGDDGALRAGNSHFYPIRPSELNPTIDDSAPAPQPKRGGASNLSYHGGAIVQFAHVVPVYWGSYFGSGDGASMRTAMDQFYGNFGNTGEFNVITQYYDTVTGSNRYISLTSLYNNGDYYDSSNPPTNVTDSAVQGEVLKAIGVKGYDASTIYEVFIPPTSYSSNGSSDSCGGPNLQYCAYHGSFTNGGNTVLYSIEPYPSCSGCWAFSSGVGGGQEGNNQYDAQHFACHETREAVTDPVNAWYDRRGYEADDKCAWSPAPFIDGAFAYQYEWSNAVSGCVKTR